MKIKRREEEVLAPEEFTRDAAEVRREDKRFRRNVEAELVEAVFAAGRPEAEAVADAGIVVVVRPKSAFQTKFCIFSKGAQRRLAAHCFAPEIYLFVLVFRRRVFREVKHFAERGCEFRARRRGYRLPVNAALDPAEVKHCKALRREVRVLDADVDIFTAVRTVHVEL